ncbi:conserved hypothetical integral membrane protein [gamma proteobacterium HIMB55]|nr:conserved hypothetical integral membrane protein [gamma proteobacterium HIMB55]
MTDASSLSPVQLTERRERVFLVLAGVFLSAMTLLNVIGITKFVQLGPLAVAVGVLPYPITFLCTDLISELYGKSRANFLVTVGLFINGFILLVMTAGQYATSVDPANMPPWQILQLAQPIPLPSGDSLEGNVELFTVMYAMTSGAVTASMAAYITAQYCDVQLFHFWKRVTKGKHLWLRNNFSTLLSQLVDSVMVVTVTFGAVFLRGEMAFQTLLVLVASNYGFKAAVALLDTIPLYILVARLRRYLALDEHELAVPEANA